MTITQKLGSFLWWSYPRGSLEYDVMVAIILGFIFLTPRHVFRDQPRPLPPVAAAHVPARTPIPTLSSGLAARPAGQ